MNTVVLSGGLDSTCALALTVEGAGKQNTRAVSFDYGQRHIRELESARAVADYFEVEHYTANLTGLLSGSALVGQTPVPEGHYSDESMAATVVNGRNLLFAAAAVALGFPTDSVVFGVHAGDHPIYPDCRPEFWVPLAKAVAGAYQVSVETPFIGLSKAELLAIGYAAGAPLHLTWSCYQGQGRHCGRCGTCVERAEAFALAEIDDPTIYEDSEYWRSVTA